MNLSRVFKIFKKILLITFDKLGFNLLFRLRNRGKLVILLYHGINESDELYNPLHFKKEVFHEQLKYLIRKKTQFINLNTWISLIRLKKIRNLNYIVISFDDGFKNVVEKAYPILKAYQIPAILYVITDFIGSKQLIKGNFIPIYLNNLSKNTFNFHYNGEKITYTINTRKELWSCFYDIKTKLLKLDRNERKKQFKQFKNPNTKGKLGSLYQDYIYASWDHLINVDHKILEIGSHSHSHPFLGSMTFTNEIKSELEISKRTLEKKINMVINHFSYPNGSYDERIIKYVKETGYKTAVTTSSNINTKQTNLFLLKRLTIPKDMIYFKSKISGLLFYLNDLPRKFKIKRLKNWFK